MSATQGEISPNKAPGLGPVREGGQHWLAERFLSAAMLILSLWLILSLAMLPDLGHDIIREWLRKPLGAVPMALFVIGAFVHGLDGLKVVIDDYIHDEGNRVGVGFALTMAAIFGAGLALFALARISLGAA